MSGRAGQDWPGTLVVGGLLVALGILCALVSVVLSVLSRRRSPGGWVRPPSLALTVTQHRAVLAQIAGRRPLPPYEVPMARDIAQTVVSGGPVVAMLTGLAVMMVGLAVVSLPTGWLAAVSAAFGLLLGGLTGLAARDRTRSCLFLATAASGPSPAVHPGAAPWPGAR